MRLSNTDCIQKLVVNILNRTKTSISWKILKISNHCEKLYNESRTCCLTSQIRTALVGPSASTLTNSIPEPGRNFSTLISCSLGIVPDGDCLTE